MKLFALTLIFTGAGLAWSAEGKPGGKPAPKAAVKAKPQLSVRELADREARKHDQNRNGRIEGSEVSVLRMDFSRHPQSWLAQFDDNGNRQLEDAEIAAIRFTPAPSPKKAKGKPPAKKK